MRKIWFGIALCATLVACGNENKKAKSTTPVRSAFTEVSSNDHRPAKALFGQALQLAPDFEAAKTALDDLNKG